MSKPTGRLRWMVGRIPADDVAEGFSYDGFKLQMETIIDGWSTSPDWEDIPLVDEYGVEIAAYVIMKPLKSKASKD